MVRCVMLLVLVAVLSAPAAAQDRPAPPSGFPPQIMAARAVEKDGRVIVTFSTPQLQPKQYTVKVDKGGKKVTETRTKVEFAQWADVDVPIDGKEVKAFGVDGKAIDPKDLPKRLGKATQVAVVIHPPDAEPKLDPYYLRVLREDIVVFTGPGTKFFFGGKK